MKEKIIILGACGHTMYFNLQMLNQDITTPFASVKENLSVSGCLKYSGICERVKVSNGRWVSSGQW